MALFQELNGLWWLLLLLGPLLFLQRRLHFEIQGVFLLVTRRVDIALVLFSILFLPGVALHEVSHYLAARLMGVRTGRISLIPRPVPDGKLQMGYVETAPTDVLRDSLIGAAPLLVGGIAVAYIGVVQLRLIDLWETVMQENPAEMFDLLSLLLRQPDFWLWFYLAFTVSSTMFPSASDRRAWLPVVLVIAILLITGLVFGAGPWLVEHLAVPFNQVLLAVDVVLGISLFLHIILLVPFLAARLILSRLTGFQIVPGGRG